MQWLLKAKFCRAALSFNFSFAPAHSLHAGKTCSFMPMIHANPSQFRRPRGLVIDRCSGGFSLVEVTLAMGIASFALLVIFSMLPLGMSTTQGTGRQAAETEIFNRIGSELSSTPVYADPIAHKDNDMLYLYTQPKSVANSPGRFPAYFDIEGNEVASSAANAVFIVQCAVDQSDVDTKKTIWAPIGTDNGNLGSGLGEIRWATVRIGFHKDPGVADNANPNATPDPQITKRTFVLANRGT